MRFSIVLLSCLMLLACGKTGALYLSEEPPEAQPQNTPQQDTQAQDQETTTGGTAN